MSHLREISSVRQLNPWQIIIVGDEPESASQEDVAGREVFVVAIRGGAALLSDATILRDSQNDYSRVIPTDRSVVNPEISDKVNEILENLGLEAGSML